MQKSSNDFCNKYWKSIVMSDWDMSQNTNTGAEILWKQPWLVSQSKCFIHPLFRHYFLQSRATIKRHCRGRWRSKVVFSSLSPALWALLGQGPISRMKWMTDRWMPVAGLPLTTTVKMHSQQRRKTTKKWVTGSHCCTSAGAGSGCVCTCVCVCWVMRSCLTVELCGKYPVLWVRFIFQCLKAKLHFLPIHFFMLWGVRKSTMDIGS